MKQSRLMELAGLPVTESKMAELDDLVQMVIVKLAAMKADDKFVNGVCTKIKEDVAEIRD